MDQFQLVFLFFLLFISLLFTNPIPKSLSSILALSYISKVLKKNLSLPLNATFIILCALGLLTVYLLLFLILSVSSLISSSM